MEAKNNVPINKVNYKEEIELPILGLYEPIFSRIHFFTLHVIIFSFNMILHLIFQVLLSDKSNYFPELAYTWKKNAEYLLIHLDVFSLYTNIFFFILCLKEEDSDGLRITHIGRGRSDGWRGGQGISKFEVAQMILH